jgi:hypothetical protein
VDDFLADIDGRAEGLEGDADNVNGAHHAGAEAPRLEQKQSLSLAIWHYSTPAPLTFAKP